MKKEKIYMSMGSMKPGREHYVRETEGYVFDVNGTKIGLIYRRPYWFATHYESGVDCTPPSDAGSYKRKWKNKETLLEKLQELNFDFDRICQRTDIKACIKMVNEYKEKQS